MLAHFLCVFFIYFYYAIQYFQVTDTTKKTSRLHQYININT